ncbi:O-antigen ligase family protein [Agaribacter flavus]|uniref:O-antigen ligase family protein n=1 Tax=Agaribacter flavus TaxID=1902781 RepID=A0ABV7FNJ8_9ALTE
MFVTFVYLLIAGSIILLISAPWVAAVSYAFLSMLQPQYIWFWAFQNVSLFKITAGIAIMGWGFCMLRGQINWRVYNNFIFFGVIALLALYHLSELFTPFKSYSSSVSSDLVMGIYFTIVLMFIVVLGLINNKLAVQFLSWGFIALTLYYAWWANELYFSGNWAMFKNGRLTGPFGSPYGDGNVLSIIWVIGMPFIIFSIFNVKSIWVKVGLICCIPLILHAIILCASRGALLSTGMATLFAATIVRSKAFNIILALGMGIFIIDQGAQLMSRTVSTVQQARSETEQPLNPRLVSWKVGYELVKSRPLFGVGPQRFLEASSFYTDNRSPHVAHNTLVNFAANLGIFAGFIYLGFFYKAWRMFKQNKKKLEESPDKLFEFVNNATICSMVGFFFGALFLDLIIFEPFFFLLILLVANNFLISQLGDKQQAVVDNLKQTKTTRA